MRVRSARVAWRPGRVEAIAEALGLGGAQLLRHAWEPQGESWVFSRPGLSLVAHSWPELGLATLDLYAQEGVDVSAWEALERG